MKKRILLALAILLLSDLSAKSYSDSRDWSLLDTRGETFKLSSVSGNTPVLLIFWATWCVPCKKEMSENESLFNSYQDKGIQVLLVAEDNQRTQARVKPYVEAKGYKWRVLLDTDGEVLKRYSGTNLPYMVLLDKSGSPVEKIRGALKDTGALTTKIEKLLGATGE